MNASHIRVGVLGNVDAGKTTLIGTLVSSTLDNGKGSSRSQVVKHKHEKETGRTSTVSQHLIGFDADGKVLTTTSDAEMAERSSRVVSLMDLAGHEKYFKTTVAGLSMGMADYALVLVNSAQPPTHMTMHHIRLCATCGIPVILVMTKADSCPSHVFQHCKKQLIEKLRASDIGKRQYAIKNEKDIETVQDKLHSLVPLLTISCVTGEGLDLLKKLLFTLPKRRHHENKRANRPFEFLIEDVFNIKGVGTVISGFVNAGEFHKCTSGPIHIGPLPNGTYIKAMVRSIQVCRVDVDHVYAGHSACFALSSVSKIQRMAICKGMVALKELPNPAVVKAFKAEICMLRGEPVTVMKGKYHATAHILHLKKAVKVIDIENSNPANVGAMGGYPEDRASVLRPGDRAIVTFRVVNGTIYVRKGMRIILRDGPIRAIGMITETATPYY